MKVFIVDDHKSNRELCALMLNSVASDVSTYASGFELIEALTQAVELPDIIILDVMMPELNGFETAQLVRDSLPEKHIPIIFLTMLDDHITFDKCLSYGDDFIPKPVKRNVIISKVQAHSRIARMYKEAALQRDELRQFREQISYDYTVAESIFANLMEAMTVEVKNITGVGYVSTPYTVFNGDLIVLSRRPHGGIYAMIADATGHGLPAAISAIPATRAFFTMAAKGLPLGEIVTELNDTLNRFLPPGMMLAASLFEISANGLDVSWWGGGLPDAYVLNQAGDIDYRLTSRHMPLGVLTAKEFDATLAHFKLSPEQTIVTYTDGVTEASNTSGEQFGEERLEQVLAHAPDNIIRALYEAVHQFSGSQRADDLSILTIKALVSSQGTEEMIELSPKTTPSQFPIDSQLTFNHEMIRSTVLVSELRGYVKGFVPAGGHLDYISSVISELMANAIDHGLLQLDSSLKDDPDGFFEFYKLREQRLAELDSSAWIRIEMKYRPQQHSLSILLSHSGVGFDFDNTAEPSPLDATHGRGILLLNSLCESLHYSDGGKTVEAVYRLT